jgi:HrpA-like RNA helicase
LELHSTLPVTEQDRVFDIAPEGIRKCIISTNIAETSVTIDGVRFVIDSGKAKEMAIDTKTGTSKLSEFWISKSSAKQRAGRAGRTGPGICYRFYSEKEHNALLEYPVPEIMRMPLHSVCLQIKALDFGDPRVFNFLEAPPEKAMENAIGELKNMDCLDDFEDVTHLGRILVALPVELPLGKMLILAKVPVFLSRSLISWN